MVPYLKKIAITKACRDPVVPFLKKKTQLIEPSSVFDMLFRLTLPKPSF
jgi:hypothetical protein